MWEQLQRHLFTIHRKRQFWQSSKPARSTLHQIRYACQPGFPLMASTDATLSRDSLLAKKFSKHWGAGLVEPPKRQSRILECQVFSVVASAEVVGGVVDELQWIFAVCAPSGAYQMFRQSQADRPSPPKAVAVFPSCSTPIFPALRALLPEGKSTNPLRVIRRHALPRFLPDDLECLSGLMPRQIGA